MSDADTTRFCARIIGPLMLLIGAVVIIRFDDLVLMMPAILQDGPLTFITGIFTLIAGFTLFAAHHHFGSAAAIAITILGGLTIVRGVSLMLAPDIIASFANTILNSGPAVMAAGALAALLGVWLTYAGWFEKTA
ncbi:MAG: hypothetical protein AB7P07_15540 [Hyphomonadaceae bacterium]